MPNGMEYCYWNLVKCEENERCTTLYRKVCPTFWRLWSPNPMSDPISDPRSIIFPSVRISRSPATSAIVQFLKLCTCTSTEMWNELNYASKFVFCSQYTISPRQNYQWINKSKYLFQNDASMNEIDQVSLMAAEKTFITCTKKQAKVQGSSLTGSNIRVSKLHRVVCGC